MIKFEGKTQSCKGIDRGKRAAIAGWPGNGWPLLSTGMKEGERGPSRGVFRQGKQHVPKPGGKRELGCGRGQEPVEVRAE